MNNAQIYIFVYFILRVHNHKKRLCQDHKINTLFT